MLARRKSPLCGRRYLRSKARTQLRSLRSQINRLFTEPARVVTIRLSRCDPTQSPQRQTSAPPVTGRRRDKLNTPSQRPVKIRFEGEYVPGRQQCGIAGSIMRSVVLERGKPQGTLREFRLRRMRDLIHATSAQHGDSVSQV